MRHGWNVVAERSIRSGSLAAALVSAIFAPLLLLPACAFGSSASSRTQTQPGSKAHTLALVDAKTGRLGGYLPDPDTHGPSSVVSDRMGGWYVGGRFEHVGSIARTGVAHVKSDGDVDASFVPDLPTDVYVNPILFRAGVVYVGSHNGKGVYALDAKSGERLWHTSTTRDGNVNGLVMGDGVLFAGGDFTRIGGVARNGIAALDPASGKVTSWRVRLRNSAGYRGMAAVVALATANRNVYLAGVFDSIAGVKRELGMAAVSSRTGRPTAWAPKFKGAARSLEGTDSILVIHRQVLAGSVDRGFAAFDTRSARALSWTKRLKGGVWALASFGNTAYLGGAPDHGFTRAGGKSVNNLASAVLPKGTFTNWKPRLGRCTHVEAMAVSGGKVLIAGYFSPKAC